MASVSAAEPSSPGKWIRPRNSVISIIRELWDSRELLMQFVQRDLTVRYAQAVMGFAWALLMPVLIVGAGLVFRVVMVTLSESQPDGGDIAALAVKSLPWAFFSGGLSIATQSVITNSNLIGKIYFPREALPIATVIAQCIDLAIGLAVLLPIVPFLGMHFSLNGLYSVLLLVLLVVFTAGCALMLSCANLFYRDVKYIVQVILSFGVFATPVFFEPQMLGPKGARIMLALPLSPFIQGLDISMVRGHSLLSTVILASRKGDVVVWAPWMLGYAAASAAFVFGVGLLVFRRQSGRFAEMA
jgi:ABC-type polysaccharide/polyol phosphate export permease